MFSHSIICRNCSVVVSESDDVELLLEMANELDCPECGSPELAVEDFDDDSSDDDFMSWVYTCGDCSWQGPQDDLMVVDQMELIQQLMSGDITEDFFVEMGSRIGEPSCPECGSAEVGPD